MGWGSTSWPLGNGEGSKNTGEGIPAGEQKKVLCEGQFGEIEARGCFFFWPRNSQENQIQVSVLSKQLCGAAVSRGCLVNKGVQIGGLNSAS